MRRSAPFAAALLLSGCSLIDSSGFHIPYSFDPHEFVLALGDNSNSSVPSVPCQAQPSDSCTQPQVQMQAPKVDNATTTFACDPTAHCAANFELRKALPIDLTHAMTPLPSEALQFGISFVDLQRIDYWAVPPMNGQPELNVTTPPIELYVAPMAALDEHDPQATLLGTVAPLPAGSTTCMDDVESSPATHVSAGTTVCKVKLNGPGADALGGFVKNFKSAPFQIIAHTIITVAAGTPIPSGTLDFNVQPTVQLSIIK
jgi:hypothetical protein